MTISINYKKVMALFLIICSLIALSQLATFAADKSSMKDNTVAINGYDTVAYFTENRAVKGNSEYSYTWNEATWYFSKPENRDLFATNPERFAPQFRGHCAYGLAKGKLVAANPEEWTIVDGKLYMNYNRTFRDQWRQDKSAMVKKANENWAEVRN